MPGVIFLDFDGPIFPSKVFLFPENSPNNSKAKCDEFGLHPYVTYWKADPFAIAMLNNLYSIYPYDLVVSSSWADDWLHQKDNIQNVLNANNLEYNLHNDWRTPREKYYTRHEQIFEWLDSHPEYEDKYIILDDLASGDSLDEPKVLEELNIIQDNVFLVNIHDGLSYNQYQKILHKVSHW